LKYQKLRVLCDHTKFFRLDIPHAKTLVIKHCYTPIKLPKKLEELRVSDCGNEVFLSNLNGILSFVFIHDWFFTCFQLQMLPLSLHFLYLRNEKFIVTSMPVLSNLLTLTIDNCEDIRRMDQLHIKCPNIQTLVFNDKNVEDLKVFAIFTN
jgi:hypothetical protein